MSRKTTRLEDIARLAGVSIATASRALNDSPAVNDRTKQTIWKLAKEHDYPFRRHMPAGPIGAQGTIALVVPRPQGREGRLSELFDAEQIANLRAAYDGLVDQASDSRRAYIDADSAFQVRQYNDAPGGSLSGFEIAYQQNMTFLPRFW